MELACLFARFQGSSALWRSRQIVGSVLRNASDVLLVHLIRVQDRVETFSGSGQPRPRNGFHVRRNGFAVSSAVPPEPFWQVRLCFLVPTSSVAKRLDLTFGHASNPVPGMVAVRKAAMPARLLLEAGLPQHVISPRFRGNCPVRAARPERCGMRACECPAGQAAGAVQRALGAGGGPGAAPPGRKAHRPPAATRLSSGETEGSVPFSLEDRSTVPGCQHERHQNQTVNHAQEAKLIVLVAKVLRSRLGQRGGLGRACGRACCGPRGKAAGTWSAG